MIDQVTELCKPSVHGSDEAMAYFFCRKSQVESQDVNLALKTMAYDIARKDTLYAKYLTDVVESWTRSEKNDIALAAAQQDGSLEVYDKPTSNSTEVPDATVTIAGSSDNTASLAGMTCVEPAEDPTVFTEAARIQKDLNENMAAIEKAITELQSNHAERQVIAVPSVYRHWEDLFGKYFTGVAKHVYLVVDGLDECNETEAFALCTAVNKTFAATQRNSTAHITLLMNTRSAPLITDFISAASVLQIRNEQNVSDLSKFLEKRLKSGWQNKLVSQTLRLDVKKAVLGNCDGNFLKASLIADEIASLSREDVVRSFLQDLLATM